jgi:hypothetical protein
LKPLKVVNPYAEALTFLDERTRTRPDHVKYLSLIDAIALLHQHQREIKQQTHRGKVIEYIEATAADIALANRLAHEVLGRSLDELPPQTRRMLGGLCALVAERMQAQSLTRNEVRFTRREIRERLGLSDTQARIHLDRLVQLEYVLTHGGRNGQRFVYELLFDSDIGDSAPHLPGLIAVEALTTMATSRGSNPDLAGRLRGAHGSLAASSRTASKAVNANAEAVSNDEADDDGENAHTGPLNGKSCRNVPAATAFSLAASSAALADHAAHAVE